MNQKVNSKTPFDKDGVIRNPSDVELGCSFFFVGHSRYNHSNTCSLVEG